MNGDGNTPTTAEGGTDPAGTGPVTAGQGEGAIGGHHQRAIPPFVLTEVRLLLDNLTAPETNAGFNTPARADPGSIEDSIRPPEAKWTWDGNDARQKQIVSANDIGKYGLQTDIHKLFKLASIAPVIWQLVRDFTVATWIWRNEAARQKEVVATGDVGKTGYQADIDSYFRLDNATTVVWTPVAKPNATPAPFELSTGASDAEAYHDFYKLQIAFEDVWAELIDDSLGTTAQAFYAKWDSLMNQGMSYDLKDGASVPELESISSLITTVKALVPVINPQIHSANPVVFNSVAAEAQALIGAAVATITQFNAGASKELKDAFGLDLQNVQAELEAANSRWGAFIAALGANAKPVSDALDSALQILVDLKSAFSQGAAERVAAFGVIPAESIGGYDQLENFLNDVRIILGLPKVTVPTSSAKEDYDPYFEDVSLDIRSAQDYVDSFVFAYTKLTPAANQNQASRLSEQIADSLKKGIDDAQILLNLASDSFRQIHGQDVRSAIGKLQAALKGITDLAYGVTYGSINPNHIDPGYTGTDPNPKVTDVTGPIADAQTILQGVQSGYRAEPGQSGTIESAASDHKFPELETLFNRLSDMLKERYRFDVFAPASINYGLLLNYRQKWVPQSYQVGDLVKTIPLGAGEVQKYTTKTVVKKARNAKELDESLRSNKEDKSETQRADAEIFSAANEKTDFNANASGSFKIGVYDINADTHFGKDQGVDSKNTKRDQRESVFKSAQEYRDQHRMEVTTDTSREDENTSYRELRNPNDELTVTYLFYELQRRYLVSEALHRATPVVLVANDVPAPHEVDQAWLVRYDWILKRAILDDSFLAALEYIATDYTGEEVTLITLELAVQHQRSVVDKLSQQVMLANQSLNSATVGLTQYEDASVNDQRNKEYGKFVQSFFDPLGISQAGTMDNGTSNRARLEFANQALQRAQGKVNDLTGQMTTEVTALQGAIDRYTAAATRHYGMLADIDRLRLHVKDNILHYMQAIWSHEPADQRYFRLYNLDVPVFEHNTKVELKGITPQSEPTNAKELLAAFDGAHATVKVNLPNPELSPQTKKLHQVADVDNLIGFKGNYMIFPLTDFDNYMTWYLIHNYIDFDTSGPYLSDPDPGAGLEPEALRIAMEAIQAQAPQAFADNSDKFVEVMVRLLSDEAEQMVIVPSDQLYIEALPGTHPILEDFKLMHRALDVKKVQAEVRHAELENLRLAARLASGEYGDPDVEKKIVIEGGRVPVTVSPGT